MTETGAFAEDVLNDLRRQRTGGVRSVDASTYAVTLRRHFGQAAPDWNGEVTGRPAFFTLATVDVLVAGKQVIVFDKSNTPLWGATLAYEVDGKFIESHSSENEPPAPCLESRGSLFFFDQGVLTAFNLHTGAVRWRLPSIGITKLTTDDKGMLYVSTTSAGMESIQYSDQVNMRDKVVPIIMKIDPANGKTLWRVQQIGDACYESGGFLYFTRSQHSAFAALQAAAWGGSAGVDNFRVLHIDSRTGRSLWEYYQPRTPHAVDFRGTKFLLLYGDELQVLKFLSL